MKVFSFILTVMMSLKTYAHQTEFASSLLSTTNAGQHILQIAGSLTAFEAEINYVYGKDAYKTPKEFQELVKKHFRNNVFFSVNGKDTLKFINPMVLLGHETKVVVEVQNLPESINSFLYTNTMFKEVPNNKMGVMFLTEGFPKGELILANKNDQTISQVLSDNGWQPREVGTDENSPLNTDMKYSSIIFILLGLGISTAAFYAWSIAINKKALQ